MKKTITILLAAIMALSLAACGGNKSDDKPKDAQTSPKSSDASAPETSTKPEESTPQAETSTPETPVETTTEPCELELSPGQYWVGLHIPEGVYNVEVISGIGNMMTKSGVTASLGSGPAADYGDTYSNLTLANGDILKLTQSLTVKISTKEAYYSTLSTYTNPATEEKELSAGTYTIGKDVPPGIYNLSVVKGTVVNVNLSDYSFTAMLSNDASLAESSGSSYKNLELLEGQILQVSSGTVRLTPTEIVPPTPQK